MEAIIQVLGPTGIMIAVFILIFWSSYSSSIKIFDWIDQQTIGNRTYIQEKLGLMFIEVSDERLKVFLLSFSFGPAFLIFVLFMFIGIWKLGLIFAIISGVIFWKLPKPIVDMMYKRRVKAYQGQMVDALTLLANGIRAGLSVPQALSMVVDELPAPISQEFNVVLQQNKIGVTLEECFENLQKRIPLADNQMFVTSINILRESGGNLAETFDTIIFVIRERIRVQQKIDTYVAQGTTQGAIIFCIPFVMAGMFTSMDPEGMLKAATHPIGLILMISALGLTLLGGVIIYKIIQIDI